MLTKNLRFEGYFYISVIYTFFQSLSILCRSKEPAAIFLVLEIDLIEKDLQESRWVWNKHNTLSHRETILIMLGVQAGIAWEDSAFTLLKRWLDDEDEDEDEEKGREGERKREEQNRLSYFEPILQLQRAYRYSRSSILHFDPCVKLNVPSLSIPPGSG